MHDIGVEPSTQLLERKVVSDRAIASLFNRPSSARFLKLVRLRLGDGMPMTREVAWYDLTAAPALVDWDVTGSAYQFLQQHCGIALTDGEQTIEAAMSNADEMAAFGFEEPARVCCSSAKPMLPADRWWNTWRGHFGVMLTPTGLP